MDKAYYSPLLLRLDYFFLLQINEISSKLIKKINNQVKLILYEFSKCFEGYMFRVSGFYVQTIDYNLFH